MALVVLRVHRGASGSPINFASAISLLFAASPWLMPSPAGIAAGLAAHALWFVACERLIPVHAPVHPPAPRPSPPPSPAAPAGVVQLARRPREFVHVPVLTVFDETPDIRTFRVARPEGFDFKAGQFLTVRVRADGKEHVRCYSISSVPGAQGYLEISVKRHGVVSGTLHATLRPGSMLSVRAPAGAFVYPAGEDRPIVLVAGGVGITPLMSMIRHAADSEPMRPVTLFYSARTEADLAFRDEIRLLDRRHPQIRAFFAITGGPAGDAFPGRMDESLIRTMCPDVAHAICLLCGPRQMIDAMKTLLLSMGVPQTRIKFEIFDAAVAASAGSPAPAPPPARAARTAPQVRFEKSGLTATAKPGGTLLEAAEECGAAIPSLCRAGVCGTCRTRVIDGDVECASRVLDDQDRQDGFVLACVSHVRSDSTVDA